MLKMGKIWAKGASCSTCFYITLLSYPVILLGVHVFGVPVSRVSVLVVPILGVPVSSVAVLGVPALGVPV